MAAMTHSLVSEAVYHSLTPLSVWNLSKIAHTRLMSAARMYGPAARCKRVTPIWRM
jgi:hypothetical protein